MPNTINLSAFNSLIVISFYNTAIQKHDALVCETKDIAREQLLRCHKLKHIVEIRTTDATVYMKEAHHDTQLI